MVAIKTSNTNKSSGRRILTDIVVPKRKVTADQMFRPPAPSVKRPERHAFRIITGRKKLFIGILLLGVGIVLFGIVTSKMEITVRPQNIRMPMNKTILLSRKSDDPGKLFMRTVAVTDTEEGIFDGDIISSSVEKKAKGTVVIFNKSSQAPQTLVATTRLASPDGKIYRIPQTITVPGYYIENKEIIPGSKETEVVADKAGEDYNIGLVDFTIPGFAGGPKFKTIFGRSKTPIQGGFAGLENTVSPEDLDHAVIKLTAEADAQAGALLQSKIPKNTILVTQSVESVIIDKNIAYVSDQGPNKFKLILKSEARGVTIDQDRLTQLFSDVKLPKPFRAVHLDDLTYTITGYQYDGSDGQLHIVGEAEFESLIDTDVIKKFVAENRISKSRDILSSFLPLAAVEVRFRPFWFKYTPSDPGRIDIILSTR